MSDLQSDKPLGCLIVGPDGEILRVSLYDSSQDTADSGSKARECGMFAWKQNSLVTGVWILHNLSKEAHHF